MAGGLDLMLLATVIPAVIVIVAMISRRHGAPPDDRHADGHGSPADPHDGKPPL